MSTLGYWREPLTAASDASVAWLAPGPTGLQVWVCTFGGRAVGRISRQPGHGTGCSAALDGWIWTEHHPGSAAALLGIKESPTRRFGTVPEAKKAIAAALASLPGPLAP